MKKTITYKGDDLGGPYEYTETIDVPSIMDRIKTVVNRYTTEAECPTPTTPFCIEKGDIITIIDKNGRECRAMIQSVANQYTGDDYVLKEVRMDYFDKQ